jgi:hypothetical protein
MLKKTWRTRDWREMRTDETRGNPLSHRRTFLAYPARITLHGLWALAAFLSILLKNSLL